SFQHLKFVSYLWKKKTSETVVAIIHQLSDTSYLDQHLATTREGASEKGIWCKEDRCVFKSTFTLDVVTTDALNVKFQNK
ncbi:UNVERIFIED_CONTAM: hypothetical protein Sindi_1657900, partial [Sesamum indicum]